MAILTDAFLKNKAYQICKRYNHAQPISFSFTEDELVQFVRSILGFAELENSTKAWQPAFDATSTKQEDLAVKLCAEIAGTGGENGSPPDLVRILEMASELYQAERSDPLRGPQESVARNSFDGMASQQNIVSSQDCDRLALQTISLIAASRGVKAMDISSDALAQRVLWHELIRAGHAFSLTNEFLDAEV